MAIRVAIAEDQRLLREALGALLAREPDITVVGEASTGREAIELVQAKRPDVLVLDISLPKLTASRLREPCCCAIPSSRCSLCRYTITSTSCTGRSRPAPSVTSTNPRP
jgi:DNA-binding NarL/FixJ family response regulator